VSLSAEPAPARREPGPRKALVRAAWTLALALIAVLIIMVFVCNVYHVDSGSMEPAIFGSPRDGESVLVLYGRSSPERFDLVCLQRVGDPVPIVKRVGGLSGEAVQISQGDLLVNGSRLPPDAPRPPPILLFDDRWQSVEEFFDFGSKARWSREGAAWRLDARGLSPGSREGQISLHHPLRDDYLAPDHAIVRGENDVNDAILECWVEIPRTGAIEAVVDLVEQGDTFRFSLGFAGSSKLSSRLSRVSPGPVSELLASASAADPDPGGWRRLCCSNVDNTVAMQVEGVPGLSLRATYRENRFDPSDIIREGKAIGPRVRLGAAQIDPAAAPDTVHASFRSIRISRDVSYTARGSHGISAPQDLGPGECFLLGDNSAASRDSREWGPVEVSRILGRAVWVVWPPSHLRRVEGAVRPFWAAGTHP